MTVSRSPYPGMDSFLEGQQREKAAKTLEQVEAMASALSGVRETLNALSANIALLTDEIRTMSAMQQEQAEQLQDVKDGYRKVLSRVEQRHGLLR